MVFCRKNRPEDTITLCGQNVDFLLLNVPVRVIYHCVLEVNIARRLVLKYLPLGEFKWLWLKVVFIHIT